MKLDKEQLEALTPEQRKAYEDGNAVAVQMYKPTFSGTMYAIAAGLLVVGMLLPIWAPVSLLTYELMGGAALLWMSGYKLASNATSFLRTQVEIERALTNHIREAIQRTVEKHGLNAFDDEGTNQSDTCLNKEDDGSSEVQ